MSKARAYSVGVIEGSATSFNIHMFLQLPTGTMVRAFSVSRLEDCTDWDEASSGEAQESAMKEVCQAKNLVEVCAACSGIGRGVEKRLPCYIRLMACIDYVG